MPRANAATSRAGTISPIPLRTTGCRTPGKSAATTGVPHMNASTCTIPKDSVLLIEGTVITSQAAKKSGMLSAGKVPKKDMCARYLSIKGWRSLPDGLAHGIPRAGKHEMHICHLRQHMWDRVDQEVDPLFMREPPHKADQALPLSQPEPLREWLAPLPVKAQRSRSAG